MISLRTRKKNKINGTGSLTTAQKSERNTTKKRGAAKKRRRGENAPRDTTAVPSLAESWKEQKIMGGPERKKKKYRRGEGNVIKAETNDATSIASNMTKPRNKLVEKRIQGQTAGSGLHLVESSSFFPTETVKEPHSNDVLFGRGGWIYKHPGNTLYRKLVQVNKVVYQSCTVSAKTKLSESIITTLETAHYPPSRFLQLNKETNEWHVITNMEKKLKKTSQALREGADKIRDSSSVLAGATGAAQEQTSSSYGSSPTSNSNHRTTTESARQRMLKIQQEEDEPVGRIPALAASDNGAGALGGRRMSDFLDNPLESIHRMLFIEQSQSDDLLAKLNEFNNTAFETISTLSSEKPKRRRKKKTTTEEEGSSPNSENDPDVAPQEVPAHSRPLSSCSFSSITANRQERKDSKNTTTTTTTTTRELRVPSLKEDYRGSTDTPKDSKQGGKVNKESDLGCDRDPTLPSAVVRLPGDDNGLVVPGGLNNHHDNIDPVDDLLKSAPITLVDDIPGVDYSSTAEMTDDATSTCSSVLVEDNQEEQEDHGFFHHEEGDDKNSKARSIVAALACWEAEQDQQDERQWPWIAHDNDETGHQDPLLSAPLVEMDQWN